jgi:hypothetical protein
VATIIDQFDFNRYEVVKVSGLVDDPLRVVLDSGMANKPSSVDAFGRLRTSQPLTLFDSNHRYQDNGLWATSTASGGTVTFNSNQGLVDLAVTTTSGSKVYRETLKTFAYQPGKSLLVMTTFVFSPAKVNLRQRVGYYSDSNGMYLELNGIGASSLSFVERSYVSGSVTETRISQANWNVDKLDGTGTSGMTLDPTKAQILWMDIEWLGLGTVRMGFVIDGKFITCHQFHHANLITSTYITTACLPLRYEIENTGTTASASTLKQICSTVISEGGYEIRGAQQGIGTPITTPTTLGTAGTYYPIVSLRLKTTRLDAVVILTALSFMGITNNANYNWQVRSGTVTIGGTWVSASSTSSVEYNITGTGLTDGRVLAQGYSSASNQSVSSIDVLRDELFKFQLERDSFTGTSYELSLVASGSLLNAAVHGSMDFEEITR